MNMRKILAIVFFSVWIGIAEAASYEYDFRNTKLSDALAKIAEDNPGLHLSFIYNELDKYKVSAKIYADDFPNALKQLIGLNPVSVINEGGSYYIEALQHGRYCYGGKIVDTDNIPVEAATVMLLAPKDSTVITYGITDNQGRFSIPCDRKGVLGKISCVGHKTILRRFDSFSIGTVILPEIVIALDEVKVKADEGVLYADRSVYLPNSRQRSASNNAYDLLRRMAIPQVNVNAIDNEVTDNAGNQIRVFINGMPALKEELGSMRTSDVKKVEYLENPADARFQGAARVINIILQTYEYGGYTRLTLKEGFLIGLKSRVEAYSAFSYKNMNYGFYVGSHNSRSHLGGTCEEEIYQLMSEDSFVPVYRNEIVKNYKSTEDRYPVTFQASYNTEKTQIRNMLSFSRVSSDTSAEGIVSIFGNDRDIDTGYSKKTPNSSNSFSYSGYQFYSLPRDFSISLEPEFRYSRIHDRYGYAVDGVSISERFAKEDAYRFRLEGYINKKIRQNNTLSMFLWTGGNINRLYYKGDVDYHDRFHYLNLSYGIQYNQLINNRLYFHVDGGITGFISDINGKKVNELGGFTHLNFQYALNRKNRLGLNFTCATGTPQVSMKSPDILKMNELLYITGNPELKKSPKLWADLNYNWLCSDKFWLSIFGGYEGAFNNFLMTYEPYNDGQAVIRRILNEGCFHKENIGFKLRVNLLDGNFTLQMRPQMAFYRISGLNNKNYSSPEFNADVFYYLGNFYFQASYQLKDDYLDSYMNSIIRTRDYYSLMTGWSNSAWNLRLSVSNIFDKGRMCYENECHSQYYSSKTTVNGPTYCPQINFTVSYTVGYGKKINHENEVGERAGAASAIIK